MPSKSLYIVESVGVGALSKAAGAAYLEANGQTLPKVIYPEIRVLTADKPTLNFTYYPAESLRGDPEQGTGLSSFTYPYPIPIIRDHLTAPGPLGGMASETYGRVRKPAQFVRDTKDGYVLAMPEITHPEAIEGVLSGRWLTVSLGSRCGSVRCSICDQELTDAGCEHEKGQEYENDGGSLNTAYWQIRELKAKEISFVVTPSDDQAGVLNPNFTESAGARKTIPRILVGDEHGVFDLASGARVEESLFLPKKAERRIFGLNVHGSRPPKEITMPDKKPTDNAEAMKLWLDEGTRLGSLNRSEQFKGAGRYLLMGYGHDHDVYLDANGDGTSSWAYQSDPYGFYDSADSPTDAQAAPDATNGGHTHEVLGGVVRNSAGKASHTHYLEPVHAGKERVESTKAPTPAADTDANEPLTLGVLYLLPDHHPDFYKPDTAEAVNVDEKPLTSKDRNKLPETAFCGPDRSFPANDKSHVQNGLARLAGSKLSSSQKASVKACLIRKGKAMGMKFSTEAANCAAKLIDAAHRIEFNLYPLPQTGEELTAVLSQVHEVAHTPSERDAILGRIAAHSRSFLETAEWQTQFGELTNCEEGDPIEIAVTAENYALLWAAMGMASQTQTEEKLTGSQSEDEPVVETEAAAKETETPGETDADAETAEQVLVPPAPAEVDETAVKAAVTAVEVKVAKDLAGLDFEKQIERLREAVTDATEQAAVQTQRASHALAHSCAILMKMLRKPAARGRTLQVLAKELSSRSTDSLNDKLSDLCAEYDEGGPAVANLPRLEDPTVPETAGEDKGRTATGKEQQVLTGSRLTPVEELELEEGEPSTYLHSPILTNLFGITGDNPAS